MSEDKRAETPVVVAEAKPAAEVAKPEAAKPAAKATPKKAAAKPAVTKGAAKPAPAKSAAPKLSKLEETKAKNKKALAEALAMAQAVQIAQPPKAVAPAPAKASKPAKAVKAKKPKLVRHAFSMPDVEYAQLATLKKRIAALGGNVKRSELVRAGIALLAVLSDVELTAVMAKVERIKTGRPAK